MAINQPLKGGPNKLYNLMTVFNRGIDKKTADDVASDSSFRNLKNFYGANEGSLSKRNGAYNSYIKDFIGALVEGRYSEKFNIVNNNFDETKETVLERLKDFYDTVLCGVKKEVEHTDLKETRYFIFDKIIGFQIIKNNKFLEAMQDYETILNGDYSYKAASSTISFGCLVISGGFSTIKRISETEEKNKLCGLYLTRLSIEMEYITNEGYTVKLEVDSVDPTISNSPNRRWIYYPANYDFKQGVESYIEVSDEYRPLGPIDIGNYNGLSYLPTGKDYLIQIDQNPEEKTTHEKYTNESSIFKIIGGEEQENLYKPTPIEATKIGFNILAQEPLSYVDQSGVVAKVRGVFYSIYVNDEEQPVLNVPYNKSFNVHILYTGETPPETPKYRPDNGETDEEKNPYKDLPGEWKADSNNSIFICSGLDSDQRFELKIDLGELPFVTYLDTTSSIIDETGSIGKINDLIFSSTNLKFINNQLVLYGGHGYIFFSEYDLFTYFPNYFYIYIATEAGEEAVTSIKYFRQFHAVFTNKRIKKMVGTFGGADFGIYSLNDFVGCPNGNTVRAVGNNLFFLGNDGIYKLKQGYLGEGTENVERIDTLIGGELNLSNVLEAFTLDNNYVVVKNDGYSWFVYDLETEAFYEYNLESKTGQVYKGEEVDEDYKKKALPFYSIFEASLYDSNGGFFIVPIYDYEYDRQFTSHKGKGVDFHLFRFSDLSFLEEKDKYKDGYGFVSTLETHNLSMGYPTHIKKFKEIYIKLLNKSGHSIPLYVTIYVDDRVIINPDDYEIIYDAPSNTYYYVRRVANNFKLDAGNVLGEFILGVDPLGSKTIQQIKIRVGESGKSIRIKISDGFNDSIGLSLGGSEVVGLPNRNRNEYDYTVSAMGIVYKLKKVKGE